MLGTKTYLKLAVATAASIQEIIIAVPINRR